MAKREFGHLEVEWHPTKNLPLEFSSSLRIGLRYWWLGKCGHGWEALLSNRIKGSKCPFCSNSRVLIGFNDLATTHPELAAEWHPTKNGELTTLQVTAGSNKKRWWLGKCGHEWETKLSSRTGASSCCPICSNSRVLIGFNDLAATHPELAAEWHPTKNGELKPSEITAGSNKKRWWLGKCGHEWEAAPYSRTGGKQHGCPICSNLKVLEGFNDLATTHSELAAEWHPTKNGELKPNQVIAGSGKKVWWRGECHHEWESAPCSRVNGSGCPVCSGAKISEGFNDLATKYPKIAAEWHPTKNQFTAKQITAGSGKKAWWLGECGHEWETAIYSRVSGSGCSVCAGKTTLEGFNDLATKYPKIAAEWHPTKNQVTAKQITAGTSTKFWWLGECGHEWEISPNLRIKGNGCPVCSGYKVLAGFNDLASVSSIIAAEWHPTKNGEIAPHQITAGTSTKFWWLGRCGHEWESNPYNRILGKGCPVCIGKRVVAGVNDLATVNPTIAAEWHPTKNGKLTTKEFTLNSNKIFWWLGKCGHEWDAAISTRTRRDLGCPVCSNHRVLADYNDLATTNPEIASEWHPTKNAELTARQVTAGSNRKCWWLGKCGHEWDAVINSRTGRSLGCPVCSNSRVLIGFNDLATTHPILASEWHPTKNGALTAKHVSTGSGKKVWWLGTCGHEWESRIGHRNDGSGCHHCVHRISKAEEQIKTFIIKLALIVEGSNRKILKPQEIDLWIPEKKLGIEFNGLYWHSEKYRGKESHYGKWQASKKADIQLIQIWEDDWNLRPEIIMKALAHKLGVSKAESVARDTKVTPITEQQAEKFLDENHLRGFASGSHYLGVVETGDIAKMQAVMAMEETTGNEKSLEIIRYASIATVAEDFSKLLSYAISAYSPDSFTVIADHCEADEGFYESNDFIAEKELPPDYMYVVKNERKPRSEYSLERFRDDPALLWEEGLTEMELADLNGLDRIWDAGKTRYRLGI